VVRAWVAELADGLEHPATPVMAIAVSTHIAAAAMAVTKRRKGS